MTCTGVYRSERSQRNKGSEGRKSLCRHSAISGSADGQKEEGRRTSAERRRSTETSSCSHTAHRRPEEETERHRTVRGKKTEKERGIVRLKVTRDRREREKRFIGEKGKKSVCVVG